MIDLHCHILPGFDDGPDDWPLALKMCQQAYRDGINGVVATPHFFREIFPTPDVREVQQAIVKLQARCDEIFEGPFQLYMGSDCRLHADVSDNVRAGTVPTINGSRYLLLELPDRGLPPGVDDFIFRMAVAGITPIITHPERNSVLQRHPSILFELIEGGAYAQATAQSYTGYFGNTARAAVELMTEHNLVQIIATDAHDLKQRPPVLSEARSRAAEIVGSDQARDMVEELPRAILSNETIAFPPPVRPEREGGRRRGFLRSLLGS